MIKIKNKISIILKSIGILIFTLTLLLFFYAAFFYDPSKYKEEIVQEKILEEETSEDIKEKEIENKIAEDEPVEVEVPEIKTTIKDGLFATVGNKAITKLDVVNEIKRILIINNISYSDDKRDELQEVAVKAIIKRNVKKIEIERLNYKKFSEEDLRKEIDTAASRLEMDAQTFKNICISNGLDFSMIENHIITELLWNSLIFNLYNNRISINLNEIEEQIKVNKNQKLPIEYLISEIVIQAVEKDKVNSTIKEIKNRINNEGFENVAMSSSISQSAGQGGELGWLNENEISKIFKKQIEDTPVGSISKPILMNEGILIFKIRDKRSAQKKLSEDQLKRQLINSEKTKILNMYSISHYDSLFRSITVKIINE